MKGNILIIDDNKSVLTALELLLQLEFNEVHTLKNPNALLSTLQQSQIDVILLDMNFKAGINTGNEGLYWLKRILETDASISVVMITAHGDVELAVRAVKEGAFDFILKPWDNNKLIATLHAALKLRASNKENLSLREKNKNLKQQINKPGQIIIGESIAMKKVLDLIKKVAATDANILITGENGTGKEIIAQEIHRLSNRNNEIMVSVDMGAISETLFESELFGHEKGSFTDAKESRAGKLETANKGSLFLDEIGNLSLSLQAKILAALQNRSITRLGANIPTSIDIRLISATNKDLDQMITDGFFREDLLYRINAITIEIPPLRDRQNDVLLLADFYLNSYANKYNKSKLSLSAQAKRKLLDYNWPGNVRELQHSIERAVILASEKELSANDFNFKCGNNTLKSNNGKLTIEEMEKQLILDSIEKENGNMSAVAQNLGVTRQTLYNKLKKYKL
ncbi:MAG: sigma-54 dependent transcriptional regulator [Salinivirgaceae bacterium]|jgi:DNA-binding NtrC family response regulator|nr:sigma-54 dependent transcriptional regulator [Salinivirgaceae bacterium]